MQMTDIFIKRPVFASVLSLLLLLIGARAYFDLPIRQFPSIEASVVTVTTGYPGATPKLMEGFVTAPIENALAGVEGLDFMSSSNTIGSSVITLYFKLGYKVDKVISEVSNAVASVRNKLPSDINDPIIAKQDPNAEPTMYIAFTSDKMSSEAISDYCLRVVQPQLATVEGVAKADIYGSPYAMRLWLNPLRMTALGITADDVQAALNKNNIQSAAGNLNGKWLESTITANTDLQTAAEFNNLLLRENNNYLVRLKDVGHAELGTSNDRMSAFINGQRTVVMTITPQSTANPLTVSKIVNRIMPGIRANMPGNLKVEIMYDASMFISQSLHEVKKTIFEATFFVVIVIFLFLGSLRAVLIPVLTIPLSLIGVCSLMLAMGYTINTLTLLAWVLAIGLVVDDAIVILENIHRLREQGLSAMDAALQGARQISFAVIAMTFTLAAVYAPIGFTYGLTGILFREFAFTLASAVIISGFIALTLSPMMCSKLLTHTENKSALSHRIDTLFQGLMLSYKSFLTKVLKHKNRVAWLAAIVYISCYFLYITLPTELAPREDQGYLLGLGFGPTSANLAYTEKYSAEIADVFKNVPEQIGYGVINGFNGVNSAVAFLVFKPWNERPRTANDIMQSIFFPMISIPGMMAFPMNPPALPGSSGIENPVQFVLKTTASYEQLNTVVDKLIAATRLNPRLLNVDTDLKLDKSQVNVNIDRNKAGDLGIGMNSIANALNLSFGQPIASRFIMSGRSYDVIPQLSSSFTDNPHKINDLSLRTKSGALVPFSTIVNLTESIAPKDLTHFQQQRAATINAGLAPGYNLGDALTFLNSQAKAILPDNIQIDYKGESRQLQESHGAMLITFLFAVVFIYLVLAAQFESFLYPLVVMTSVLLSLSGALVAMHLTNSTMNIFTQIGLITLVGLISKHGILIVEFANQLAEKGMERTAAVIESACLRLRPILMTTATMILSAIPLALAGGAGAESRRQIGWVIVGGMSFGTLLTLFIVPTAYILVPHLPTGLRKVAKALNTKVLTPIILNIKGR